MRKTVSKRTIIRRVIAVLLAVTAVILICLPPADAEALTERGDFSMDGSTIAGYSGNAVDLSIPDTVTAIGKDAFSSCDSLVTVTIPDSVRTIDYAAFENCKNLQKIFIPESVKTIGSSAFSGCENLREINIPSKVSKIGSAAFARCTSLGSISVSSGNEYYACADGVLYSKDGKKLVQYLAGRTLSTYAMPSSVEEIEEYAFWGANLLTSVSISGRVKKIPEYAFDNCSGLTTVVIPPSVTALQAYSFGDCTNLQSIVIPTSVGYIDDKAFYCSDDVEIQFTDAPVVSQTPDTQGVSGNEVVSGNSVIESEDPSDDGSTMQGYSTDYTENVLPGELGSAKIVGGSAVLLMSSDMPVKGFAIDEAEVEDSISASGGNTTFSSDEFDMIDGTLAHYGGTDAEVDVPAGVNAIGDRVFYKNDTIQRITLPDTVTEIGDFAFARSSLTRVRIPEGTEYIGYAAFYHCNELTDVSIPDSVQMIELGAFDGSLWLDNWKNTEDGNNFLIFGDGILLGYKGEGGNITIPDGVKKIGAGCFEGNTSITGVTLPASLTMVGEDAFNGCSGLNAVQLPEGVETIEDRAFKNTALAAVRIPSTVSEIGLGAFDTTGGTDGTGTTPPLQLVVFAGDDLPDIGSKPTAARLSAQNLRSRAFEGVENAIVNPSCDLNSGTVLKTDHYGFRGQIYCITAMASENGAGTLELQLATKEPSETTGVVSIAQQVMIDGNKYMMTGVREQAFAPYESCEEWSGRRLTGITIDGNASEDLNALLSGISFSNTPGSIEDDRTEDTAIMVRLNPAGFQEADTIKASAKIPGSVEPYLLNISEDEAIREKLNLAFYNYYGQVGDITMVPLSISMTDQTGNIAIEKLATGKLEVIIPVPSRFIGMQDLKVGAVDTNGALEELSTEYLTVDGTECLRFVASHLSPYAVYKIQTAVPQAVQNTTDGTGEIAGTAVIETQIESESLAGNQVAGIVKTLNRRVGSIEAKWFVIVILLSAAAILTLWKDKKGYR